MDDQHQHLDKHVTEPLLTTLGETRSALIAAQRQLRRGCVQARAVEAVTAYIDDLGSEPN